MPLLDDELPAIGNSEARMSFHVQSGEAGKHAEITGSTLSTDIACKPVSKNGLDLIGGSIAQSRLNSGSSPAF